MGIFDLFKSKETRSSLENPAVPLTFPVELMMDGLFGPTTDAGVRVSELTAASNSTVHACVRVIAETLAQVPLFTYEQTADGVELAEDNPVYELLHESPNPWMDSHVFREVMQACVLLWGNAYAVIERDNAGRPIALWPRNPSKTHPFIADQGTNNQRLMYTSSDGQKDGEWEWFDNADVIHIKGLGFDGLMGLSPVKYFMKQAIGLSTAAEIFGSRFFANNGRPGGILVYSGNLSPDVKEQIRKSWQEAQAGNNQGRPAVLTGAWDFKPISTPPDEMQFLETRKLQQEIIAGMFRIPPHMIGVLQRSTNNNIEQQSLEFQRNCMMPWFSKWQAELTRKLLPKVQIGRNAGKRYFVKFDTSELTMGDFKTTMDALSVGLLNGTYSINEARKKLGLNPVENGDMHTVQAQLTNIDTLAEPPEPAPEPPPEAAPTDNVDPQDEVNALSTAYSKALVRDKRDIKVVTKLFADPLWVIASRISGLAEKELNAMPLSQGSMSSIVDDVLSGMAKRATDWTTENVAVELEKVGRALKVGIYRELAVTKAKS